MIQDNQLLNAADAFLKTHAEWEKQTSDEIRHLRARDVKAAEEIMKRKPILTDLYQNQLKHLFENREELAALPEETKEALRSSQAVFASLSAEYQKELDMALTNSERLMNLIKTTITQQHVTSQFYGNSGALMPNEAPRSISINKNV
ncbi:MAG TPA: hypothetical protein DIS76_06095 [Rhodospirillaceae bacterium]|nr:hypothetical protein [Rhodospirillaceae bacterium]